MRNVKWKKTMEARIDYLLAMLQIYGYRITIANTNLGSMCDIDIRKYVPKKVLWMELYEQVRVNHWTIDLPRYCDDLIGRLEKLLKEAEDKYYYTGRV